MVTIKDIAEKAQLSSATISRVLKGDLTLSVSPETRQKIMNLAQDLGYTKHLKNKHPNKKAPSVLSNGTPRAKSWLTSTTIPSVPTSSRPPAFSAIKSSAPSTT